MEIADAARKHGVADSDVEHAVHNALRIIGQGDRDLYIGADRPGGFSKSWSSTTTANRW